MLRLHPRWSVQIHITLVEAYIAIKYNSLYGVWIKIVRMPLLMHVLFPNGLPCYFQYELYVASCYCRLRHTLIQADTVDIRLWEIGVCMPRRIFVTECCEVVVFCALFIIIYITIILLCVEVFFWQLCASSALSWRECSLGWLLPVGRFGFKSRISSGQLVILFQNLHKQRYLLIYFQSSHT